MGTLLYFCIQKIANTYRILHEFSDKVDEDHLDVCLMMSILGQNQARRLG